MCSQSFITALLRQISLTPSAFLYSWAVAFIRKSSKPSTPLSLSQSAAKQLWPGQNPVGHSLRLGAVDEKSHNVNELLADGPAYQVIGIARDTRGIQFDGSDSKRVYLQLADDHLDGRPILIRAEADPADVIRAIDPIVSSVDNDLVTTSATLEELLRRTAPFIISGLSAAVALTVGLFGLRACRAGDLWHGQLYCGSSHP